MRLTGYQENHIAEEKNHFIRGHILLPTILSAVEDLSHPLRLLQWQVNKPTWHQLWVRLRAFYFCLFSHAFYFENLKYTEC